MWRVILDNQSPVLASLNRCLTEHPDASNGVCMNKKMVLHIGLPKTGTTTLQKHFFPKYSAYSGPSLNLGINAAATPVKTSPHFRTYKRLLETYRQFSGSRPPSVNGWRDDLSRWVDELVFDEFGLVIISHEGLSEWARGASEVWPVHYESPLASGSHPIRQSLRFPNFLHDLTGHEQVARI